MTDSPDELQQARDRGRRAAEELVRQQAPEEPLLRVAWADGMGDTDYVREAVSQAREAGATWAQIGTALNISWETAKSRFSRTGYERQRRYRERKRQQGDNDG